MCLCLLFFSKTFNAWYSVLELATIYVHFCNSQVQVKYWGSVRWCLKDDFSTADVYICISLGRTPSFKTCPKGHYLTTFIKEVVICFLL